MIFYNAIISYIAIVDDLAPQVDLISSNKMTPLTPIQHPYIRDLMISIMVFGKTLSGAKNSRMGRLSEKFRKWFRKPWSSINSTGMFSKGFWDKWDWDMEGKELVVLEKGIGGSL
jgi:hypothetical protein